jgi:hypothetical protein
MDDFVLWFLSIFLLFATFLKFCCFHGCDYCKPFEGKIPEAVT